MKEGIRGVWGNLGQISDGVGVKEVCLQDGCGFGFGDE